MRTMRRLMLVDVSALVVLTAFALVGSTVYAGEAPTVADQIAAAIAVDSAACCAADASVATAKNEAGSGLPYADAFLRNARDPLADAPASPEYFLAYADKEAAVYGRVYFSSQESLDSASDMDSKELYTSAYLRSPDGTQIPYGDVALKLENTFCPVSGVGAAALDTDRLLEMSFDPSFAKNCKAGACAVGDGFKLNYNAMEFGVCCPSCAKMFGENPEKFLPNLRREVERVLGASIVSEQKGD